MMQMIIRALRIPSTGLMLALACALVAGGAGLVGAQTGVGQEDDPSILRPRAQDEKSLIAEKATDVLARVALARLRSTPNPTREHFRAAALALRIIRRLEPTDAELLRLEIEAWSTAGDDKEALDATRELLRIDPGDQVAQLRVVIAGLDRLQDVDARLEAYERILGPRGKAIDPSVRSRMALDASLLARDNGDEKAYLDYLMQAMTLDPTNKGAAALFGSYVLGKTDDPKKRVEVLCNIILSDPLDAGTFENLALELLSHGAYVGALRAYQLGTQIAVAAGWSMTPERVFDLALCDWRVRGPIAALGRINRVLQDSMIAQEQARARAEAEGLPVPPVRPQYLPPELDLMRLAIAVSQRSEEGIKTILDSYLTAGDLQMQQIAGITADTPEMAQRIKVTLEALKLQRLWAMLFSRQRADQAQQLFDEILAENTRVTDAEAAADSGDDGSSPGEEGATSRPPLQPEVIQRFRGWLAMINGHDRDAELLLEPLVETDVNARWAMAVLREQQGNTREAMLHFAKVAQDNPRSALSTAAWYRLVALNESVVAPSSVAQELDDYAFNFAPWLNTLASDPASFMSLRVRHVDPVIDSLGVVRVAVTVRNVSRWPLAVGAGRPIPKRLLLAPRLRLKGKDATVLIDPSVALIQNRLRLEPAEEVTVVVTPTLGGLGAMLDFTPGAIASIRWQGVQGFKGGGEAGYQAGSMTVTTLSDVLVRESLDDSVGTDVLVSRIGSLGGAELLRTIMVARRALVEGLHDGTDLETARTLMAAILDRWPSMAPLEQAIVLGWLGESGVGVDDEFSAPLRASIPDPSTYPALALLLGFVTDPEDPLLQSLIAGNDDDLSRLAFIWRDLLRAKGKDASAEAIEAPATP